MLEKSTFTVTFNLFYTLKQVTGFREKKEKLQEAADVPGLSQTQNTRGRHKSQSHKTANTTAQAGGETSV